MLNRSRRKRPADKSLNVHKRTAKYPRTSSGEYSAAAAERAFNLRQKNPKAFRRLPNELQDSAQDFEHVEAIIKATKESVIAFPSVARAELRLVRPMPAEIFELLRDVPDLGERYSPRDLLELAESEEFLNWLRRALRALHPKRGRPRDQEKISQIAALLNQGVKSKDAGPQLFPHEFAPAVAFRSYRSKHRTEIEKERRRLRGEIL